MCDECKFYDCQDGEELAHTDPDEAIEAYLDTLCDPPYMGGPPETNRAKFPETVTVTSYKPMPIDTNILDAEQILEDLLERLDEEHGNPHGDETKPSPAMLAAAQALVDVVKAEYRVWMCESCGSQEVDVEEWLAANPDFFGEPHGLAVD